MDLTKTDKLGMKFIKLSIKGLSKKKLMGILALCANSKEDDRHSSDEIIHDVIKEWKKRSEHEKNYNIDELLSYLDILELSDYKNIVKGENFV